MIRISCGSLSDIENGKSLPSAQTITRLMTLEGMDIFWLLLGESAEEKDYPVSKVKIKSSIQLIKELVENQENSIVICRQLEYCLADPLPDEP